MTLCYHTYIYVLPLEPDFLLFIWRGYLLLGPVLALFLRLCCGLRCLGLRGLLLRLLRWVDTANIVAVVVEVRVSSNRLSGVDRLIYY